MAVLAVTAPLTVPADAGEGIGKIDCRGGRATEVPNGPAVWQRFRAPKFEAGLDVGGVDQTVKSSAISPSNSKKIAVTNGNSVYVSHDGGCDWRMALRLDRVPNPALPLSGTLTEIKAVFVAPGSNAFFALAEELETKGAVAGRPHVLRSSTGEPNSWTLQDSGLPPLGTPLALEGHRTNPNVLYLTFANAREETNCPPQPLPCDQSQQGQRLGLMYASTDGGRTWENRTDPGDLNTIAPIKYVSVDDNDPLGNTVWVVSNGQLRKSTTGGRAFVAPPGVPQDGFSFTAVESLSNTPGSRGLELVAFSSERGMIRLHRGKWVRSDVPFSAVASVSQRPEGDVAVVTTGAGGVPSQVWRIYPDDFIDYELGVGLGGKTFKLTFGWESITPATTNLSTFIGSGTGPQGAGTYYVREQNQMLRFLGSRARLENPTAPGITLDAPKPPTGTISPNRDDIDVPLNGTRTVRYTLRLPPSPTPLDVYLLVDNSGSMIPFINDLKDNLRLVAEALRGEQIDVQMGLGRINVQPDKAQLPIDNPRTPEDESKPKPIYEKLRGIGPINPELFTQLGRFDGNSGSGSEPQLEALYQSVTGRGLSLENLGPLVGYSIEPGQDAGFRDELNPIKVIVHATDERFSRNISGPAHNDPAAVAQVLKDADVKQIGLSLDQQLAEEDLAFMARETGAVAPRGGTDCDGDGRIGPDDIREGQPLVCGQSIGLDKTLVNLLRSLSDPATITLSPVPSPAIKSVSDDAFRIDAKSETRRRFSVTYTCEGLAEGEHQAEVVATLRGMEIARTINTVNCGGAKARVPQPAAAALEPGGPPPPPQPQPLAPAPVPVNPVPQPQTQVQGQTQVNPQAGMADQEEQQFQLALAGNDLGQEDQDQLAMTGLSYEDAAVGVLGTGMAIAAAVAGGVALRRRTRTAPAKVTARRW